MGAHELVGSSRGQELGIKWGPRPGVLLALPPLRPRGEARGGRLLRPHRPEPGLSVPGAPVVLVRNRSWLSGGEKHVSPAKRLFPPSLVVSVAPLQTRFLLEKKKNKPLRIREDERANFCCPPSSSPGLIEALLPGGRRLLPACPRPGSGHGLHRGRGKHNPGRNSPLPGRFSAPSRWPFVWARLLLPRTFARSRRHIGTLRTSRGRAPRWHRALGLPEGLGV